jgi:predicted Rossmann-fold nucleotide-binding protein
MLALYDERKVVAVMGGHALLRTDEVYRNVVLIGKHLAAKGCLMVTGGGPGAMEAAHLGVWLAGHDDATVDDALAMLFSAPSYKDFGWLSTAFALMDKLPRVSDCCSIGIPTWFYGHEPATPFATHIAKFFDNSIREDGLLAIAKGGVIYSPGSAGTMQEIFQDAAQNHYLTCGYASPMVFLGSEYWSRKFPVYPLLEELHERGCYKNLILSLTDSPSEAEDAIMQFVQ